MRIWTPVLALLVACSAGTLKAQQRGGSQAQRMAKAREALSKYKAEDPEGHAALMKLRETDRNAFRRKVGELMRGAGSGQQRQAGDTPGRKSSMLDTVKVTRDIVYATYGQREVKLDLYLPKAPPEGKLPCILVIHGGGWRSGNKERFARYASGFAAKGFAAACIGYRLQPEVEIKGCVEDAKAAARWVRANAAKHNIDQGRLGAFGGSAGAHLSAMLGTSFKEANLEGKGGNKGVSSRVHAVVAMAVPADLSRIGALSRKLKGQAKLISPTTYVGRDSARFLLIHAKDDNFVPYSQSPLLLGKLKAARVEAKLITLDSGGHSFWNGPHGEKALADAAAFFEKTLLGGRK
jgi:acetyl esterase/lipase